MLGKNLQIAAAGNATGEVLGIEDVFSTYLYTGNGSTQTITNEIDLAGEGGMVWCKSRTAAQDHALYDTARGISKRLYSNSTIFEINDSGVNQFSSNGFQVGSSASCNASGDNYVSWTFRKAPKFFDVVTYAGTGSPQTIAHNLGSVPGCIIVKRIDSSGDNWTVYHRGLSTPESSYIFLNTTAASGTGYNGYWNGTQPTSSVFSVGGDGSINPSGGTMVAYLFAHDAGGFGDSGTESVIKCGSFTADGSGNATVNLGWEPQWILFKRSDNSLGGSWFLVDVLRGAPVTGDARRLLANTSDAEANFGSFYPTASGFASQAGNLQAGGTYIYIAIRRGPMKTPTDATKVFSAITATVSSGTKRTTDFPIDLQILNNRPANGIAGIYAFDRLRGVSTNDTAGGTYLNTTSTAAEASTYAMTRFFDNTGFKDPAFLDTLSEVWWSFRRAPGFFDVVAYTGVTSGSVTVNHNLGVSPELIITKARTGTTNPDWFVGSSYLPNGFTALGDVLRLNSNVASSSQGYFSSVTTTSFLADNVIARSGQTYIAYLFVTCPGVSKVGSYTGTGTTLNIDCGFTNGARFILIKRADSTGDWYVWDTARGIVSGNDPYLLLNSTAAEVTNTDYIDPLSSGFQISSTAPAAINANGGSFIFLAIA